MVKRLRKVMVSLLVFALVLPFVNLGANYAQAAVTFIKPAEGIYYSLFREAGRPDHHGVDITKSGYVPIKASASGTVIYSGFHTNSGGAPGYGNLVAIRHNIDGETFITKYAHMKYTPLVSVGQTVSQGQVIGEMGSTGDSTGQHLHFEILRGTTNMWAASTHAVNPLNYIDNDYNPPSDPTYHTYDGSWAWIRIDSASGADKVNLFGHPGYGLLTNKANNGSAYKVYDKQKSDVDGRYYYNIGNSQWVHEDNVGEFHQYVATVDYKWAVNVYDAPNGNYKSRLEPGSSYKVYKAKDGWYDLGNSTWIKQEYVKVVR